MGIDVSGLLVYGYDLGGSEESWKILQADEWGTPEVDWYAEPENDEEVEYGLGDYAGFAGAMWDRLVAASGFTEIATEADYGGYYDRRREFEKAMGVELVDYGHCDFTSYILAAPRQITAYLGEVTPVNMEELQSMLFTFKWDQKLRDALEKIGITPKQEKPTWLLASSYGG